MRRVRPRLRVAAPLRALLAGTLLIGSIGSCELPKPQIPSIGAVPTSAPSATAAGATGRVAPQSAPAAGSTIATVRASRVTGITTP